MNTPTSIPELLCTLQTLLSSLPNIPSGPSTPILPRLIPSLPSQTSPLTTTPTATNPLPALLTHLSTAILPFLNQSSLSPQYYGFVTGGATPAALLADILVSVYDQNVQVHLPRESVATTVEVAALNGLVALFGLPEARWGVGGSGGGGGGTFTTGATSSNVLGLAVGREWVVRRAAKRAGREGDVSVAQMGVEGAMRAAGVQRVKVLSTLPHSSVAKAASIVGLGRANVVSVVKEGTEVEIDLGALEREVREAGTACVLVVSVGEVNTGRFATGGMGVWREIRRVCDERGVWVHVDGAFGLFARLLMGEDDGEYGELVKGVVGLELADSITGDGHKLLNVPYDCGFFLTRHKGLSEEVFRNGNAAYLTSSAGDAVQSPLNIGIENSRRFRALPVYATLMAYGKEGYVEMLKRQVGLARRVTRWLWGSGGYEVLPKARSEEEIIKQTFMIVLFRAKDVEVSKDLVKRVNATGKMYVSGTRWDGRPAARIAISNWQADVERDGPLIEKVLSNVLDR